MKGVMRFRKKGKLSLHYIGHFEILDRVSAKAYCLALPPALSMIHLVFHVSMLWKYLPNTSHVLDPHTIWLDEDLTYKEEPIALIDHQVKKLCSKKVASVKVIWKNHLREEAIWKAEEVM